LFATYAEYLSPLWAWCFRKQCRRGVVFGAIVHDPVRDYQVGPGWWHRWSVAAAYSFLREAFVHQPITLDTVRPCLQLRTTVVPHGLFSFPEPAIGKLKTRERLAIPASACLFLSFGHIRDNKNLPLVLEALAAQPSAWLLVAGPEATAGQRSSGSLREMAMARGVADRVRWEVGYLDPGEVSNLFHASDAVLLTYASSFRSASGVLNVAGWFRKPVLVSGGDGNLTSSVEKHRLGVTVSPDCAASIASGMAAIMESGLCPDWDDYIAANHWDVNARLVVDRLFE
jgi:glycosyltransferase involved in cell wall biosynthesis